MPIPVVPEVMEFPPEVMGLEVGQTLVVLEGMGSEVGKILVEVGLKLVGVVHQADH